MKRISLFGLVFVLAVASGTVSSARASLADPATSNYTDVKAFISDILKHHPTTAQPFVLGASDSGEMIQGLKIGDGPVKNLVVSTHHGNEYGATEVGKAVAADLAAQPIPGQTVYVIPVLNISGYNTKDRYEMYGRNYQDPNRDYPGPCGTSGPFLLKDTAALAAFIEREGIVASATLHTFSPAVVYPWGISTHDLSTPYDDIFKELVALATVESHYATGNNTQLIYPADGTFEDYAFWKHGIWSLLYELGDTHRPSLAQVEELNRVNVPGIRRALQGSPTQRAEKHDFTGKCDARLKALDLRLE